MMTNTNVPLLAPEADLEDVIEWIGTAALNIEWFQLLIKNPLFLKNNIFILLALNRKTIHHHSVVQNLKV